MGKPASSAARSRFSASSGRPSARAIAAWRRSVSGVARRSSPSTRPSSSAPTVTELIGTPPGVVTDSGRRAPSGYSSRGSPLTAPAYDAAGRPRQRACPKPRRARRVRGIRRAVPNVYDFEGRTALVTGGASGIGAATVARLREGGARTAVFDLSGEGEADVVVAGDVTRSADLEPAVDRVVAELGGLDALVCCAGVSGESLHTLDVADDEWRRVFAVNT